MSQSTDQDDDDETEDPLLGLALSPHKNAPLAKRDKLRNVVDITDSCQLFVDMPPHRRILLLFLLLALKDRVRQLRFEPWEFETEGHGLRLFFEVNGQLHELEPPPQEMARVIIREMKRVAGLDSARCRLAGALRRLATKLDAQPQQPIESRFWLRGGEDELEIVTTVYPSEAGDRVFLTFLDCPDSLSERAWKEMNEIMDLPRQTENKVC